MKTFHGWIRIAAVALAWAASALAQEPFHWRISAKVLLSPTNTWPGRDSGNLRTNLSSAGDLQAAVDLGNQILRKSGLSAELRLIETVTIGGATQRAITDRWFNVPARDSGNRSDLENETGDSAYRFNGAAVNVYVNNSPGSGVCAVPTDFDDDDDIVLVGQGGAQDMILHEVGHYLGLYHTQGATCGSCDEEGDTECALAHALGVNSDSVSDTINDSDCWKDQDTIALNNFGSLYAALDADRRGQVDRVWFNVMSYHQDDQSDATLEIFTPGQIERMGRYTNSDRRAVASGDVWFAKTDGDDSDAGDEIDDGFKTITHAAVAARDRNPGSPNLLLVRPGTYVERGVLTIHQPLTINAYAGLVRIEAGAR